MQFGKCYSTLLPLVESLKTSHVIQASQLTEVRYPEVRMQKLRRKVGLLSTEKQQL